MNDPAENLAIVARFYEAWYADGIEGLRALFHDDAQWHPDPRAPEPGPFRGPDEIIRVGTSYTREFGKYRPVLQELLPGAAPDEVLGLATYTTVGREGGQEFTLAIGHLFNVRDGKVVRFEEIPDQLEAFAAAGIDPGEWTPTRIEGIARTLVTAVDRGDAGLAEAMIARDAEVEAPCGPADWVGHDVEEFEVLVRGDEALVVATLVPRSGAAGEDRERRVAVRIESDVMGLIRRLVASADVDAARRDFEAG
jgi:hypothetical protein